MSQPNQPEDALKQGLKELHERLGQQLQSGLSGSDTENILLDTLARSSHLLQQHVSIPQFNTPGETVRARVVDVYARLAKLLERNTPEAVMADTRAMLTKLGDKIKYLTPPGRKPKNYTKESGPEQHIEKVIIPYLDKDMEQFAYEGSTYATVLKKFYNVLAQWRSEGRLKKVK